MIQSRNGRDDGGIRSEEPNESGYASRSKQDPTNTAISSTTSFVFKPNSVASAASLALPAVRLFVTFKSMLSELRLLNKGSLGSFVR